MVDSLDNVNLTAVRPATGRVLGCAPPSGPDTTADGHVLGIKNKDTSGESVLGADAYGLGRTSTAVLNLHKGLAVVGADETVRLGLVPVHVVDHTVGRVRVGEEEHVVEK